MKKLTAYPPAIFLKMFRWYCHPTMLDYIEGDLMEVYERRLKKSGKKKADILFVIDVLLLFRPGIIRPITQPSSLTSTAMFKSYLKIGWRNLLKNKGYSFINIGGLAMGMTVAILIGLWVHDELSFNQCHKNYDRIGQLWNGGTDPETGAIDGAIVMQYPVASTLKEKYPQYFKHVLLAWWINDYALTVGEEKFTRKGEFIDEGAIEMLSLKMLRGTNESLHDPHSIILSQSTAEAIFGTNEPLNKTLTINSVNKIMEVQVTGIYEDIPHNSRFGEVQFFAPWKLWESSNPWMVRSQQDWDNRPFTMYVEIAENTNMEAVNAAIKDLYYKNVPADFFKTIEKTKPFLQVVPMSTWHLYAEFENGKPAKGRITFVWLFGIVGGFVLLLACINFVNLSTARSEKRAREVGVRKAIGSAKGQLITQFLSESFMITILSFVLALALLALCQGMFNELADKRIELPFTNPVFWAVSAGFILTTALIAGVYPAFYLSSFQPVRVLKGTLLVGKVSALPRKILVVVQFTVSVVLIIGTVTVYQQIQFARNRPVGYERENVISIGMSDPNYKGKRDVIRTELLATGFVSEVAASSSPLTAIWNTTNGYEWEGKNPSLDANFAICNVSPDFGKVSGWKVLDGRDFSWEHNTDSLESIILNEAAVKYMGLQNPVGKQLTDVDEFGKPRWTRTIIGVVSDMVMESPYEPVRQTIYFYGPNAESVLNIKLDPTRGTSDALAAVEAVFKKIVPTASFDYQFVDDEYAQKFSQEMRIGKLSTVFSVIAIIISCLGLFGLASYVAEQRTKEIGLRKVLGASVLNLWKMLSKDFILLVLISSVIAMPIAYYLMNNWLQTFQYRTEVSFWIFTAVAVGALIVTLGTVSYQAIRAAMANPVNSLKTE